MVGFVARPRSFDPEQVLLAARDQFWSTGYAGTRVDEVAAAAGLGKYSLYNAFGDKHALYLRVFGEYCASIMEMTRRSLEGPDAGAFARLRSYLLSVAEATAADTAKRGCFLANATAERSGQDPQICAQARQTFTDLQRLIENCIAAAQRAGEIAPEADCVALAGLVLAVLRGIEALGKGGATGVELRMSAETVVALLPRPHSPGSE